MEQANLAELQIEFHRLAGVLGADDAALDEVLRGIDATAAPWTYLEKACAAAGPVFLAAPARGLLTAVLEGLFSRREEPEMVKTFDEWDTQTGALCIAMYPPASHQALKQKHWWGRSGPDVFGLYDDGDQTVAFYAAMDEWKVLADNPVALLRDQIDRVTEYALDASGPTMRAWR